MAAVAAIAALLLLCCIWFFCCRNKDGNDSAQYSAVLQQAELVPLTSNAAPAAAAAPANKDPAAAAAPAPALAAAAAAAAAAAPPSNAAPDNNDVASETWTVKGRQVRRGQTMKFARADAEKGQVGSTSTWLGSLGLPLTFHDKDGEHVTVFALKKPLMLEYDNAAHSPGNGIKITREKEGHGKELGIEVGWTLVGIQYKDITGMSFGEADQLLHEKVGNLPGAIPLKWTRNNGEIKVVYAYHRPLGLTFESKLPIMITQEKSGHGGDIGIKIGWKLLEINYQDVSTNADFEEVMGMLKGAIGALPPVPQ